MRRHCARCPVQGQVGTRTASAQALSYVELYSLSRSTFDRVAAHYPEVLELFRWVVGGPGSC